MKIVDIVCSGFFISTSLCFIFSCATGGPRNIEDELISALKQEKRSVQLKIDGGKELYTIDPTPKRSVNRCPIAVIKGWKGTEKFMEKEVEVCE
jgi:hypothetical protein